MCTGEHIGYRSCGVGGRHGGLSRCFLCSGPLGLNAYRPAQGRTSLRAGLLLLLLGLNGRHGVGRRRMMTRISTQTRVRWFWWQVATPLLVEELMYLRAAALPRCMFASAVGAVPVLGL